MSQPKYFNFFPFSWHYADEEVGNSYQCVIRIYGWNELNETVCVRIYDFLIPVWIELPSDEEWTDGKKSLVNNYFRKSNRNPAFQPVSILNKQKEKLYYADVVLDEKTNKYVRKTYPIVECLFRSHKGSYFFTNSLREPVVIKELRQTPLKFIAHSSSGSITPILKLMAMYKLPSAGWIRARGRVQDGNNKESTKMREYVVSCKEMVQHPNANSLPIVYPKIMSWDIETYSSDENSMPKAERSKDEVFLISCVFSDYVKNKETGQREKKITKYCLSSVEIDETVADPETKVLKFKSEYHLLKGFSQFIRETDPDVLIGYNIMGYDLKYMIARCDKQHFCLNEFFTIGAIPGKIGKEEKINWGSSARGKQDMVYIEADGRMWIDMLPYIRMNNNFSNYKLSTVCEEILKTANKDDLKIKDMFRYYREKDKYGLALAMNYCTQDSNVVLLLWEKCLTWFDITETATTCCVPPFYIVAKAQQIRIVSQMLTYCYHNNIILETNVHKADENAYVEGAIVTKPLSSVYKNVVSADFSGLYPSIIMSHNIDYTTLVTDPSIPDENCHIFEWESHISCSCPKSDGTKPVKNKNGVPRIICKSFKYRWLKENEKTYKGVIPTLIKNLIDARKKTRKTISQNETQIEELKKVFSNDNTKKIEDLEAINSVLNKRQLAFKVSANSQYGLMGASAGYLPFLQGASSVTFKGRESVIKASRHIEEKHGGKVIYNDTDSAYFYCEKIGNDPKVIWDYAKNVAADTSKLFPPPMELEFENAIYVRFLIFSKKRYVAFISDRDGNISKKWKISGIVLKRRDGCSLLRDLYKHMIEYVLKNADELTKLNHVYTCNQLREQYKQAKKGITIKKRKENDETNSLLSQMEQQIKTYEKISRTNFSVRELMNIVDTYISDMFLRDKYNHKDYVIVKGLTKETYAAKTLPPHASVANKMKQRNLIVNQGDRIEYILLDTNMKPGIDVKQDIKAEDYAFYLENAEWLKVDYLFYLEKQIIIPCDQIFEVACGVHDYMQKQYEYRFNHKIMLWSLKELFKPNLQFNNL